MKKLIFPINYIGITQGFSSNHKALDLGWNTSYGGPNHEILSACDGVVTYVKNEFKSNTSYKTYGNYIKIDHGDGITTLYAHLKYDSIKVKVGDKVKEGDVIGLMGNTGYAFGVHLHYEVIINNEKVNPLSYTYYKSNQVVGTNTISKYKPMKLESEEKMIEEKPKEEVKIDNIIFEYICPKTGMYKIQLNENEKLIIKDY